MHTQALHADSLLTCREYQQERLPTLPAVPAAGVSAEANAYSTADCLNFGTRPVTPDHEKKYRHFGLAEDALHAGPFGKVTISKPGESVQEYIKCYPETAIGQWRQERAEVGYASTTREPLGHGYVRGHVIPGDLGKAQPFGMAIHAKELDRAGQAKPIIFPIAHPLDSAQDPANPYHGMYIRSHGAWGAGEQRKRQYDWEAAGVDPARHTFGATSKQPSHDGLRKALQPELDPATAEPHLATKQWEDFQLTHRHYLARPKHLGGGDRQPTPGHTFGVASSRGELSVDSLLKGDYTQEQLQPDSDLGKSVREGWRNLGPAGRVYGIPSIRRDIPAPRHTSLANAVNHGNDPDTMQLLHPIATAERGVTEEHYLQLRTAGNIRDILAASGVQSDGQDFEHAFQQACWQDQVLGAAAGDRCSLNTFMHVRQAQRAERASVDCACLHPAHSYMTTMRLNGSLQACA